ncbi:hypothetical protein TNIN_148851 [Trichonephila inaurata madagascariensis]|uniref:Uncharacterized protein n=1 Tax=Trichonephila inaurata madagascariensis TaxID=2747483 RepID=A0A8X6YK42_9ARAC|nr:hypothetical protein TNIN_148851 [Trichonephila inaurata madagascariensis]
MPNLCHCPRLMRASLRDTQVLLGWFLQRTIHIPPPGNEKENGSTGRSRSRQFSVLDINEHKGSFSAVVESSFIRSAFVVVL